MNHKLNLDGILGKVARIAATVAIVVIFYDVARREGIVMGAATVAFFMFIAWMVWHAAVVYWPRGRRKY